MAYKSIGNCVQVLSQSTLERKKASQGGPVERHCQLPQDLGSTEFCIVLNITLYQNIVYNLVSYCIVSYYTVLCYIIVYYTLLYYVILYYTMLYYTILNYIILQNILLY